MNMRYLSSPRSISGITVSSVAAITLPGMLPMPPSTTILKIVVEKSPTNSDGEM